MQVTFRASDLSEAPGLYDSLIPLTPIMIMVNIMASKRGTVGSFNLGCNDGIEPHMEGFPVRNRLSLGSFWLIGWMIARKAKADYK